MTGTRRNVRRLVTLLALLATAVGFAACGGDGSGDDAGTSERSGSSRTKKDRGESSMVLGGRTWIGTSARARITDSGKLRISTSRSDSVDGKRMRDSLTIILDDYKGVGSYTASSRGSKFISVGLNVDSMKDAKTDAEVAAEATKALTDSSFIMLGGMTVEITAAGPDQIEGTFEYTPRPGSKHPAMMEGRFRAIVKR